MNLYRYRFGSVVFDEARFELMVDGQPVDIQRKPLQVLNLLLANLGRTVAREEFIREVWRGQPTVDNVLANAIVKLRSALGQQHASAIENIPRVGYRFIGQAERTRVTGRGDPELALHAGMPIPRRESFRLVRLLGTTPAHEVWLARHAKTGEERVFKFAATAASLPGLKREVTLARLLRNAFGDRPDFVRVFDWNFDEAPYFVESEFGGMNLEDWALQDGRLASMPRAERLGLFMQVASAVAAAHALAVLHKDLKPSNVLVAPGDGGWQCRLLDFGSGRLLDLARLGEFGITPMGLTLLTGLDSDAARGTLRYAAPELLADEPATVRSDLFALGVLLYQLLVADFRRGLEVGWERDIDDELLREDIAHATDRDPDRRFFSVAEMMQALRQLDQRWQALAEARLQDERLAEQRRQLARLRARRPWLYGTIAALATGLVATSSLYFKLSRSREQTAAQLVTATALGSFLTHDLLASADPSVSGRSDVTMAEAARRAASSVETRMAQASPEARARVHTALMETFENLSNFEAAASEADKAQADWAQSDSPDRAEIVRIRLFSVAPLSVLGRTAEVDRLLAAIEPELKAQGMPAGLTAQWLFERGGASAERMRLDAALADYRAAWAIAGKPGFPNQGLAEQVELAASDLSSLTGDAAAGESLARDLLARQVQRWGARSARSCFTRTALANALGLRGEVEQGLQTAAEAAACLDAALGPTNQRTLDALRIRAELLMRAGRYDNAEARFAELSHRYEAIEGLKSSGAIDCDSNRGQALYLGGHATGAERWFSQTLARHRQQFEFSSPQMQTLRYWLARIRLDLGRRDGIPALLDGLDPRALNQADVRPDWPARLALENARAVLH